MEKIEHLYDLEVGKDKTSSNQKEKALTISKLKTFHSKKITKEYKKEDIYNTYTQ